MNHLDDTPTHSDPTPQQHHDAPPAPPPAPRRVTATIKRRAWRDRHVRVWWILGLALLGITLYYAGSRTWWWWQEKRLIETGVRIVGEVKGWYVGEDSPPGKVLQPETQVDLAYEVDGKKYRPHASLAGRTTQIRTGEKVPIYVDRNDPTHWTARTTPGWLLGQLFGALIIAPGVLILLLVAWLKRAQVVQIYRDGDAVLAEVVGVGQTPSAPFSRLIRCAREHGESVHVVKTVLPSKHDLQPGDLLWLITPQGKPEPAIPAALFE